MPLSEVEYPSHPESLKNGKERFLVFFSSRLSGSNLLWCPDCQAVEGLIRDTFSLEAGPSAVLVYVGQRSEWKASDNIFRKEPWKVKAVPTIVRLNEAGEEVGRLVEGRNTISDELPSFI